MPTSFNLVLQCTSMMTALHKSNRIRGYENTCKTTATLDELEKPKRHNKRIESNRLHHNIVYCDWIQLI